MAYNIVLEKKESQDRVPQNGTLVSMVLKRQDADYFKCNDSNDCTFTKKIAVVNMVWIFIGNKH